MDSIITNEIEISSCRNCPYLGKDFKESSCEHPFTKTGNNWLAVKMDFNKISDTCPLPKEGFSVTIINKYKVK